jgi:hypothetical protein
MQVEIENPQIIEIKRRIRALTGSILKCRSREEADSYRPQLQREERKLENLKHKTRRS